MSRWAVLAMLAAASCGGPAVGSAVPPAPVPSATLAGDGWRVIAEVDALQALPAVQPVPGELAALLSPISSGRACPPAGGASVGALVGRGTGAFSRKGAREDIYLVDVTPCLALGDAAKTTELLIVDGASTPPKKVLGEVVVEKSLYVIPDLDGDGDNEILLVGLAHANGVSTRTARLCSVDGGKLETIYDLGVIARTDCPAGHDEAATVSFRVHGTAMEFHHEKHARPCR